VLQPNDVQDLALCVHLFELQPASLGHAQPMPKNQKQQATVARLVAASPGDALPSTQEREAELIARIPMIVAFWNQMRSMPVLRNATLMEVPGRVRELRQMLRDDEKTCANLTQIIAILITRLLR
jgi:hypothetical protein